MDIYKNIEFGEQYAWFCLFLCPSPSWSDEVPTVLIRYPTQCTDLRWGVGCSCLQEFTIPLIYMSTSVCSPLPPLCVHHGDPLGSEELDAVSPFQKDMLC